MSAVWLVYFGDYDAREVKHVCATLEGAEREWRALQARELDALRRYYADADRVSENEIQRLRREESRRPDICRFEVKP